MVGDLQEVDPATRRDPGIEQPGVDVILDIGGEEEAARPEAQVEDERAVIDLPAARRRTGGHGAGWWPENVDHPAIHGDPVPRSQAGHGAPLAREHAPERGLARSAPGHPVLGDPADPVAPEEDREARRVVLVRVGEDKEVDPPVPWGEPAVQEPDEPVRVRAAIHEDPRSAVALHEDGVPLADVEHVDRQPAVP